MKKILDCYEEQDIVETCRKCGARTELEYGDEEIETHVCPECGYKYNVVLRQDDTDEEDNFGRIPSKKSADFWK